MKKNVGKKFIPFALPLLLVIASTTPEAATNNEGTFNGFGTEPSVSVMASGEKGG